MNSRVELALQILNSHIATTGSALRIKAENVLLQALCDAGVKPLAKVGPGRPKVEVTPPQRPAAPKSLDAHEDSSPGHCLELYMQGYSLSQIGKRVGLSIPTVAARVRKAGGTIRPAGKPVRKQEATA